LTSFLLHLFFSVSLMPLTPRDAFGSFYVLLSEFNLVVLVLDTFWSSYFGCRKNFCHCFPRKITVVYSPSASEEVRCRHQPTMSSDNRTRTPLGSIGIEAIKKLAIYFANLCPHFWMLPSVLLNWFSMSFNLFCIFFKRSWNSVRCFCPIVPLSSPVLCCKGV